MRDFHLPAWFGPNEPRRRLLFRYASAIGIVVIAIALRLLLDSKLERAGFAISLIGMLAAAWIGGVGPSLVAQTMILLAEPLWFGPSQDAHSTTGARGIISLLAFYAVGLAVASLSEAWQAARRRAYEEQQEAIAQREQLRATLACVGDGVLVTDSLGRLTFMNPIAEAMTGWTLAESNGKPVRDVCAICDERTQDAVDNPVKRVLREGHILHETTRLMLTTRNDFRMPVAYSAAPILDEQGKTTGVVLIFRDETERRRAEIAQRTADQRKDEFLATLAHELRNPLAPICMGLELMKLSTDDPEAAEDVRAMMERQTHHMVRLIDDLLDVSRITRGKLELRRCQLRLDEVVRNAIDATRPAFEEAGHRLLVSLPEKPVLLDADPSRLTQILSNLLSNAAKFSPRGGRVELSAENHLAEVAVTISDNGCGIPSDMLEHIFEMFAQVRGAGALVQTGLGIGLTLVKQLVELHGGTIQVESDGPNLGSRFCVRLPAMQLPTIAKEKSPSHDSTILAKPKSSHRVLIVDDNKDALRSMCMLVRVLGNEICQAHDGLEAIEAADQFRPDIVLMDIGMPKLNGYDAAKGIRAEPWGANMILVATTGWGQDEDRRRSKEAGFDHHLVKPVDPAKLQELLAGISFRNDGHPQRLPSRDPEFERSGALAFASENNGQTTSTILDDNRRIALPK